MQAAVSSVNCGLKLTKAEALEEVHGLGEVLDGKQINRAAFQSSFLTWYRIGEHLNFSVAVRDICFEE
jgi:hypothetical protein